MTTTAVLLFFLFSLCTADFQLNINQPETLELNINHHDDQGTSGMGSSRVTEKNNNSNSSNNVVGPTGGHPVNAALLAKLAALEKRLAASEEENRQNTAKLTAMETKLAASEAVNQLNAAQLSSVEMRVNLSESRVEQLTRNNTANLAQLSSVETRVSGVEQLTRNVTDQPQVAFSAYYLGNGWIGPFRTYTYTLVYQRVHTNIGGAYNTSTGYFRAPFRGVYYFRFTATTKGSPQKMEVYMYKNNQRLFAHVGQNNHANYEYMSNAVVVQMEQGDTVDMRLWGHSSNRLYDNTLNHNTFSGFLLYAL